MTYKINTTTGNLLTEIPDGTFDNSTTSITLLGQNVTNFGEHINENFVKILENFASPTPPETPLKGQVWYNTTTGRLNVFDGQVFRTSGSPIVSPTQPTQLIAGDIWINNSTNQIWFYDGIDLILAGPVYTSQQGISGFKVETILDTLNRSRTICLLYVQNVLLGIFSKDQFVPKQQIEGYGPALKPINPGFNISNIENFKFDVTATSAEGLVLQDGTIKNAEDFAIVTVENTFSERLTIQNDNGLIIGETEQIFINIENDDLKIEHQVAGQDIVIRTKNLSNITSNAITLKGSSSYVGIFNDDPQSTLDVNGDTIIRGNLTVEGLTTTVNSNTLSVKDKNIELAATTLPTDITAAGGGITLKGATDKTILWDNISTNWTSSEHWNLNSDKVFKINNVEVLSNTSLGQTIVNSSLTTVGQLVKLKVQNGIELDGNTIKSENTLSIIPVNNIIDISSSRIINSLDPLNDTDVANKRFVVSTANNRDIAISMDITGLQYENGDDINDIDLNRQSIAELLNNIAPSVNNLGYVTEGTILRLHATRSQINNNNLNIIRKNKLFRMENSNWKFQSEF